MDDDEPLDSKRIVRLNTWAAFWRDNWQQELPTLPRPLFIEELLGY